jgi:hypothetical protein
VGVHLFKGDKGWWWMVAIVQSMVRVPKFKGSWGVAAIGVPIFFVGGWMTVI